MAISVLAPAEIDYPSSDGKPLAESDFQFTPIAYARGALREHFRDRPDVYVAADLLLYYEQGNREAVVAPDVFVVIGAPNHDRPSYLLWQEPKGPDFVLEVTSRSTRREDQGPKRERYRALGVQEYWQYDPTGDYLQPPLQGSRLVSGEYVPMPAGSTDGIRNMYSMVLGLELRVSGRGLRFRDPAGGKDLLSLGESREARERAEREREQARAGCAGARASCAGARTGCAGARAVRTGTRAGCAGAASGAARAAGDGSAPGGNRGSAPTGARTRNPTDPVAAILLS